MILASGQRREFLDKPLTYLFSHDLRLASHGLGFVAGGLRLETVGAANKLAPTHGELRDNPSRAFHVRGDNTVLGNDAIEGAVIWFSEQLLFTPDNDAGATEASIVIRTFDDALIWTRWRGKIRLGRLGYRRLARARGQGGKADKQRDGASSFEARAAVSARFETDSAKYRWVCERQCAAYGRVIIDHGNIVAARYDVYSTS